MMTCAGCPSDLCLLKLWADSHSRPIATFHLPLIPESYNRIHQIDGYSGKMRPRLTDNARRERIRIRNELTRQSAIYRQSVPDGSRIDFPLSTRCILQFTYFRRLWSQKDTLLSWDTGNPWPMYSSKWATDCEESARGFPGLFTDDKWVFAAPAVKVDWNGEPFTLVCICEV